MGGVMIFHNEQNNRHQKRNIYFGIYYILGTIILSYVRLKAIIR